jgi:hypothetical protein
LLFFIFSRLLFIAVLHNFTASGYCCSSSFHSFWLLLFFIISRLLVIAVLEEQQMGKKQTKQMPKETMIYKALHRKLRIKQNVPTIK